MMALAFFAQILIAQPPEADSSFEFYLEELVAHEMDTDAPMSRLILKGLADSIFDTDSQDVFRDRLAAIKNAYNSNPRRAQRFYELNKLLQESFSRKLKEAKRLRMIYTEAGVLVGAVIGVPVGKVLGSQSMLLLLTVPVGALAGAGVGFLLGNLFAMPDYSYEPGMLDFHALAEAENTD